MANELNAGNSLEAVSRVGRWLPPYKCTPGPLSPLRPVGSIYHILKNKKMKFLTLFLTGFALFSQPDHVAAQGGAAVNHDQMKNCCQKIVRDIQRVYYLSARNGKMRLVVRGIYTRASAVFLSLKLVNRSEQDYNIDSIRFFVAEKQRGTRIPRRLNELAPIFVYDSVRQIPGHGKTNCVFVIPRMTLSRHRRLQIEVLEKGGGRQLLVQAAGFTLETAKAI